MKTIFQTGPGLFAAASNKTEKSAPPGKVRIYLARIEAYDLDGGPLDDETSFELLVAKASKNKQLANALLILSDSLQSNKKMLEGVK